MSSVLSGSCRDGSAGFELHVLMWLQSFRYDLSCGKQVMLREYQQFEASSPFLLQEEMSSILRSETYRG